MIAAILAISLLFSLVPLGVDFDFSKNPADIVNVEKNEAHANPVIVGGLGAELLSGFASAAGLTEGNFVATVVGVIATSMGVNLAVNDGVQMGASASHNLSNLIDAADYPAWDTLSEEDKTSWGSKYNYDAAKFNELMTGLGYGETVSDYYSTGGGNFNPDDDARERLQQLGRIGMNWAEGGANSFSDIASMLTHRSGISAYFGMTPRYYFNASDIPDWPSDVPVDLNVNVGNSLVINYQNRWGEWKNYFVYGTNPEVNWVMFRYSTNALYLYCFSKGSFLYGWTVGSDGVVPNPNISNNSVNQNILGQSYYMSSLSTSFGYANGQWNMTYNEANPPNYSNMLTAMAIMLREGIQQDDGITPNMPEYPSGSDGDSGSSDVPGTTNIYYPNDERGGINPETTWPDLTEPNPTPRPDNPYNPQNPDPDTGEPTTGTDTPEWRDETEQNVLPLLDIRFDNLFPFSMLFDISKLFNKVESMTSIESSSGVYNQISIPFIWDQNANDAILLDLSWLHDLLIMVRIFNQVLLAAFLLFTCIEFWRGILTG